MGESGNNKNKDLDLHIELSGNDSKKQVGADQGAKVFVVLNERSSKFIYKYSLSDTSQELGGILLGDYTEIKGQYRVRVEAAIEAKYTEAAKGSVTFTHKTWDYINKIRDEQYPDYSVVGWFHTHPGFGIFLSSHDKFIQENFFNLPWQVAYVVDPLSGKHGFFGWHNNNIDKVAFKTEIKPQPEELISTPAEEKKDKPVVLGKIAKAAALAILLLAVGYLYVSNEAAKEQIREANKRIGELEHVVNELESNISEQYDAMKLLDQENKELALKIENMSDQESYIIYEVVEGDTLWSISEKYLGDGELMQVLSALNNLEDPDYIKVGDRLLIPPVILHGVLD